jgi:peptidoglycan/xylan/chitin deacetylase (PgdA/CDA1 family)
LREPLCLCYHAVSESWPADLSVTPEAFERQLALMARRGYTARRFTDSICVPAAGTLALTFDDAYRSVLELAEPIMRAHGMVGTVFVPTDWPGRAPAPMSWEGVSRWLGGPHESELEPLPWDGLRELAERGWEIGSHTCSHPRLSTLGAAELERELRESKAACERELGRPCRAIAYPYGDHDERVSAAVRACGYTAAGSLPRRLSPRSVNHPRIGIYHEDDERRFRLKVSPALRLLRSSRFWPE